MTKIFRSFLIFFFIFETSSDWWHTTTKMNNITCIIINEVVGLWCLTPLSIIFKFYLKLCTFSFEINESRQCGTRCLIQDVVSPQCGDKRMARRCTLNYFIMTSYHWNVRQNTHSNVTLVNHGKNNVTSCTKCSLPRSIVQILIQPLLII